MFKRKDMIVFILLFVVSLFAYLILEGNVTDFANLLEERELINDSIKNIKIEKAAVKNSETEKDIFNLKEDVQSADENKFEKDVDYLEEEFKKGYTKLKSAEWSKESDVLQNGNISVLMRILGQLDISEWPATSYCDLSPAYIKQNSEDQNCYGERFWYSGVFIEKMELIKSNSEYAKLINSGNEFYIIYGHLENGEQLLMFIMRPEGVENYYKDVIKMKSKKLNVSNMQGWYVGTLDEIPVFCLPKLYGGG